MAIQEDEKNEEKIGGTVSLDSDVVTGNGQADAENAVSSDNKAEDKDEEDTEMEVSEE